MTTFDGTLDVTIADAKVTHSTRQGTYCVVTLGSGGLKSLLEGERFGKEKFQTRVHNGGGNPAWDETHSLSLKNMKLDAQLKVKIYDKDRIKDKFLGETTVTLEELLKYDRGEVQYFPLFKKAESFGQIGVAVTFNCTEIPQQDVKNQTGGTSNQTQEYSTNLCTTEGQVEQGHPVPHNIGTSEDVTSKSQMDQGHYPLLSNTGGQVASDVCSSKGQMEQGHPLPHDIGTSNDVTSQTQRTHSL